MQSSTTVLHQAVPGSHLEEKFDSFIAIGEEEFSKLVKSSKSTTCMLDPIPTKLLKEMLPEVTDPFNRLLKKQQLDPTELVNNRPISNLSFLSKILEKAVFSHLYTFLERNIICKDFQSRFRLYHTTETALIANYLLLSSDCSCISLQLQSDDKSK